MQEVEAKFVKPLHCLVEIDTLSTRIEKLLHFTTFITIMNK
jgi:hypothetical protein